MPINNNNFANGLIDIAQDNNLPTPPKQTKQTNHKEILRKKMKRFCVISGCGDRCNWTDEGEFWQADCENGTGWLSGDENSLSEMQDIYTYCPSCGKKINFIATHDE